MPELFDSVEWKDPDQGDLPYEQAELEQPLGTRDRSRSPTGVPPSASVLLFRAVVQLFPLPLPHRTLPTETDLPCPGGADHFGPLVMRG